MPLRGLSRPRPAGRPPRSRPGRRGPRRRPFAAGCGQPPAIAPTTRNGSTAVGYGRRQWRVWLVVGQVLPRRRRTARRPGARRCSWVAHRAAQRRVRRLERIEDGPCVTGAQLHADLPVTCASVRRCAGSTTRIMAASAPRPRAPPAGRARSAPSCRRSRPRRRPGRRWSRSRRRTGRACRPPWRRAGR